MLETLLTPLLIVCVLSYLLGSINTAIIVSRVWAGDDVRKHGSGNAGMTNMLRTYGPLPAAITALGDFGKAAVAVVLSRLIFGWMGVAELDAGYIAGIFVLLGHSFPVFFRFKGGKGVMSTLGVIFCVNPLVFLIIAVLFVPLVFVFKMVSVGSVLGAVGFPFITFAVEYFSGRDPWLDTILALVISAMVLVMHRDNIKRLLTGTENKFGKKK